MNNHNSEAQQQFGLPVRPPAHQVLNDSLQEMNHSAPTLHWEGRTNPEVGPREEEVGQLAHRQNLEGNRHLPTDSHCPADSENLTLYISQTQPEEPCPEQQSDDELQEIFRSLTNEEVMSIWGPKENPFGYIEVQLLNKFEDDNWVQYVVFQYLRTSSPPVTLRLRDLVHIKVHVKEGSDANGGSNTQVDENISSNELYPNLLSHWQEIGIPLTPSGDVDLMQLNVMYHHQRNETETEADFRQRLGIDAYKKDKHILEKEPEIWHQIKCVLPEKSSEIESAWFHTFTQHQMNFHVWWGSIGSHLQWMTWNNGQIHTYGQEFHFRIQEKDRKAREFTKNAPDFLKPTVISLYGPWSLSILSEHFSEFEEYVNLNDDYCRIRNSAAPPLLPTPEMDSESIYDDIETDDWQMYASADWEVNEKTLPMFFKRNEPSSMHVEKLIMTDSLFSQSLLDPNCEVEVGDFLPNGRLCHIFIPNYVYVPPMAAQILTGLREVKSKEIHLLWRRLHQMRSRAATVMNLSSDVWKDRDTTDPLPQLDSPWRKEIRKSKTTEFPLHNIDEVQHSHAHSIIQKGDFAYRKSKNDIIQDLYDLLVRPMERMFTCDMPMSVQLLNSQHDVIKQKWIFSTIAKIASHFRWPRLSTIFILRELSKIRLLHQDSLSNPYLEEWNPMARRSPMYFAATPSTEDMFQNQTIDWMVTIDDFYPGGRLYGIHVQADRKLPPHIIHRFSKKTITAAQIKKLHQEILSTRAQWSRQVSIQLAIQNGKDPLMAQAKQPSWLNQVDLMSEADTSNVKQLPIVTFEEKCKRMHLDVTDFFFKGRLENFPTEGAKHLSIQVLQNLNLPEDIDSRDNATALGFINKFIKDNHHKIVQGRQREKALWLATPPKDQKKIHSQFKSHAPAFRDERVSRNLNRDFEKTSRNYPRSPPRTRSVTREGNKTAGTTASYSSNLITSSKQVTSSNQVTSSTQIPNEIRITAPPPRPSMWMRREDVQTQRQPPPEEIPKLKFPAEQLFQTQQVLQENPFLWNGSARSAPKWALEKMSAVTLNEIKDNRTPMAHKNRLKVSMCHRQIPLDGVNRILDVYMNKYDDNSPDLREFGIEITAVSKERGDEAQHSETRTMKIPYLDSGNLKTILTDAGKIMLPPAITDIDRDDTPLASFVSKAAYFTYQLDIVVIHAAHGTERVLSITQSHYESKFFTGFSIPWRYAALFLVKFTSIQNESAFMQNELHRVNKGFIPEPQPARMNRTGLLEKEEKSIQFSEK